MKQSSFDKFLFELEVKEKIGKICAANKKNKFICKMRPKYFDSELNDYYCCDHYPIRINF